MKFLKFLLTARIGFVLFALLAFAATLLYVEWVNTHQTPVGVQQVPHRTP